jgi:phosphatidylinositol glycan class B
MAQPGRDASDVRRLPVPGKTGTYHPAVHEQRAKDIFSLVMAIRFLNALCIATFFQPDEYFQSLEPAWQIAFGQRSGAWITWVCIFLTTAPRASKC